MRLLAVPNWSFGRNTHLLRQFKDVLETADVFVHYCQGDVDHNRTVTAFSGEPEVVESTILTLCSLAFDTIDLNRHVGVHPRIGALDVCPFVTVNGSETDFFRANAVAERVAAVVAGKYGVPVFLYERSERGRHEADLPSLRKGGFGGLAGRILKPDFGPQTFHDRLGVSVMGVRDFLIAMNVDFATEDLEVARSMAKHIRELRREGDPRFLGVRALGFPLASRKLVQLSMNATLPDITPVDPILEWVLDHAADARIRIAGTELIGVIRDVDIPTATRLPIRDQQIVETLEVS
jgi:glutamate formiminotransferase